MCFCHLFISHSYPLSPLPQSVRAYASFPSHRVGNLGETPAPNPLRGTLTFAFPPAGRFTCGASTGYGSWPLPPRSGGYFPIGKKDKRYLWSSTIREQRVKAKASGRFWVKPCAKAECFACSAFCPEFTRESTRESKGKRRFYEKMGINYWSKVLNLVFLGSK